MRGTTANAVNFDRTEPQAQCLNGVRTKTASFFDELGALVVKRWSRVNFDNSAFDRIALAALQEMPPCEHVDSLQLIEQVMDAAGGLPPQSLESDFGQPPLTLYKNELFFIDALFWLDAPTAIHEHGFSGAFHLLEGSSLHCRYEFEPKERINSRLLIGDVHLRSVECLMKGDSRAILPGRQFSHSTFHLEKPTVTIVIRTRVDQEAGPQYTYLKPFAAYDSFAKRGLMTRQLELLSFLHATGEPDYLKHTRELLSRSDFEAAFWLLEQSHRHVSADEFAALLERAHEGHGSLTELFPAVFRDMRRAGLINSRCPLVDKPEHRLLLALLLGLPDRASIFKFIRWQYDVDPVELISEWVEEMAATKVDDAAQPNVLGIRFDESSLLIFRCLLEGLSFDAIKERLKEEYDPADVESQSQDLRELFSAFYGSPLFQPLFVNDEAPPFEITGRRWKPSPRPEENGKPEAATQGIPFSGFPDCLI